MSVETCGDLCYTVEVQQFYVDLFKINRFEDGDSCYE